MKIKSKDFRVKPGEAVKLEEATDQRAAPV